MKGMVSVVQVNAYAGTESSRDNSGDLAAKPRPSWGTLTQRLDQGYEWHCSKEHCEGETPPRVLTA